MMNWLKKRMKEALTGKTEGFTLIELMIVIAIMGIAAAILIPLIFGSGDSEEKGTPQAVEQSVIGGQASVGDTVILPVSADMNSDDGSVAIGDTIVLKKSANGQ